MDIFIIYVIKTLLLPISSLLLLSIFALFLWQNQPLLAQWVLRFSIGILFLLSLPIMANFLASTQEIYPVISTQALHDPANQAIVILAGGLRKPSIEYPHKITLKSRTLERIRYGHFLAKQTGLPILVSGGEVFDSTLPAEAEVMSEVLNNEFNQPVRWQEVKSRNTAQNAFYSSAILAKAGMSHIILVTHALHMSRAMIQFQKTKLTVIPAPTVFLSNTAPWKFSLFDYLPSVHALENSTMVIHEILGQWWYQLRY